MCVCALHTRVYIVKIIKKNIQYEAVSISVVSIDIIQQPVALIVTRKQRCRNGMMKEVSIWSISCENRINVVHPKNFSSGINMGKMDEKVVEEEIISIR